MGIERKYEELIRQLRSHKNRRLGHTYNAVEFANKIDAAYIVHNHHFKTQCGAKYAICAEQVTSLRNTDTPIVMDHLLFEFLYCEAVREIDKLEDKVKKYERMLRIDEEYSDQ